MVYRDPRNTARHIYPTILLDSGLGHHSSLKQQRGAAIGGALRALPRFVALLFQSIVIAQA